jgi:8-oxo-dGTP pyrophosphatase MutT (NUDIX family)
MAHIHTESGQIDLVSEAFIVFNGKVLMRLHEKYNIWLPPGGHVELDESPEDAVIREAEEEVGLHVKLWNSAECAFWKIGAADANGYRELMPPVFMNMHVISPDHRHISMVYFAVSETNEVIQPDSHERTQCRWFSEDEIKTAESMTLTVKMYALKALECLGKPLG